MARLAVHVTPKSGRDEVVGWRGSELAVRVTAPPEGGKANCGRLQGGRSGTGVAEDRRPGRARRHARATRCSRSTASTSST